MRTSWSPTDSRCLLALSRGGADATVVREFDAVDKAFVDGGFALGEAKSVSGWIDADTIYVGTDVGPGSMPSPAIRGRSAAGAAAPR